MTCPSPSGLGSDVLQLRTKNSKLKTLPCLSLIPPTRTCKLSRSINPAGPLRKSRANSGCPPTTSSSWPRTKTRSARRAWRWPPCARRWRQVNLYPDGNAFYLKQKLAAKLGVTPGHLILGNGSNEVIEFIGHALIAPGAEVVVSQYCFAVYPIVTALFGGKLVVVPAKDYGHDLDAMLAAITPNTRVVFVANPNNPTGTTASREELARFVAAVPRERRCSRWTRPTSSSWTSRSTCCRRSAAAGSPTCC